MDEIMGYRRRQGFGVRNYVVVISTVHCANTVAEKIAYSTGAIPITHEWGCIEYDKHYNETYTALLCAGRNPNVFGILLVGLGCEQTDAKGLLDSFEAAGKMVSCLSIQEEGGSPKAVQKGMELVLHIQNEAAKQKREAFSTRDLVVAVQCGGSDWTTALFGNTTIGVMTDILCGNGGSVIMGEVGGFPGSEHIVAQRAVSHDVGLQILDMCNEIREAFKHTQGQTIEELNPTPGNKAGGITTLVEKSMGNIKKMGSSPVQGILKAGEPVPHPGLWILDIRTGGPDTHNTSGFAMAGAHITVFSTGRGSPLGNAVMPLIKLTGNPESYVKMEDIMDFNAGAVFEGKSLKETGQKLYEALLDVASGKRTKSEINGNFEFTIPRSTDNG